jgi:hypothetical protein
MEVFSIIKPQVITAQFSRGKKMGYRGTPQSVFGSDLLDV